MQEIDISNNRITIRRTKESDLDFVIAAEQHLDNIQFISPWEKGKHLASLTEADLFHLLIVENSTGIAVGYAILAGLTLAERNVEFRRVVITAKGKGYGRDTLRLIKAFVFRDLKAHRLWLDVKIGNTRAQQLYRSEGFVEEGVLRDCIYDGKNYDSLMVLSILEDEFQSLN